MLALSLSACDTRSNTQSGSPGAADLAASNATPRVRAQAVLAATWSHGDIGGVTAAGSYSQSGGTFTVSGSGADIWNAADQFQFVSQPLTGDGSITARVVSQTNTNYWAKAGVMFRETLSTGATNAFTAITPSNGGVFQARPTTGASSVTTFGPAVKAPYWVRVVRAGNTFTGYASPDGVTWTSISQYTITMASQAYVGLAVSSHANGTLSTAMFDNVTVTAAAPPPPGTWSNGDIGAVTATGSYSQSGSTFTVSGSGVDIWNAADEFQFVSQPLTGDGSITARVVSQTNTNAWAKAGIMFRETLATGATNAFTAITPSNGGVFQARLTTGASSVTTYGPAVKAPYWVRVVRAGNTFTGYVSPDGVTWTSISQYTMTMASQAYVGLAVSSHANGTLSTAVFDNVTVTVTAAAPPPPDTQAPTVPTGLAASTVTASGVTLTWNAAADLPNPGGTGVGGYYVYRNGSTTPIAMVTSGTSYTDTGLAAATAYTYQVAAFDLVIPPNVSAPCTAIKVTTQSATTATWSHGDIGGVTAAGSYSQSGGTFTVSGSGADIWNAADQFQFVSQPLTGDGSITARVVSQTNTNYWAKAGVMFRETLASGATNAFTAITLSHGTVFQARLTTGASSVTSYGPAIMAPYWVRVVRAGNTFTGYVSPDGVTWTSISQYTMTMASQAYVGLAVSSHANGTLSTAVFDNVTVTATASPVASLTPQRVALTLLQSQQFTVTATGGGAVSWSVDGIAGGNTVVGTISANGLYVPASTPGTHTITAANAASQALIGNAAVAVTDLGGIYTYHVDAARTGQNLHEYALTPATVSSGNFGKRWSCTLDGSAYAQPLYVANLSIGGGTHNVLFVATMHDSLYAFDADNPNCVTYWQASFINPGAGITSTSNANACNDIPNEYGITGTPVIDPIAQTIYLVTNTTESGSVVQRLQALNLLTGAERTNSPVKISATVPGTGDGGTTVTFKAAYQNQRPALTLAGGGVVIGWGSHCDYNVWHGWLMRYDATSLNQTAVFNATPNGAEGGIWMSGAGPALDASGNMFLSTGNGTFDDTNDVVPAPNNDFGESFLNLNPSTLAVQDFYTPSQNATWSANDQDIAASGVTVLPDTLGPSGHPNVLIGSDKQGHLWMIDRTQMSGFLPNSNNTVQYLTLPNIATCGECVFATQAYWSGTVYIGINYGPLMAFQLSGGLLPANAQQIAVPSSESSDDYSPPSPTPMISASPSGGAIVWALNNNANGTDNGNSALGPAVLHAYDATNLGTTLYTSSALASDASGNAVKFTVPVVANGHVYVAGAGKLTVYGLAP